MARILECSLYEPVKKYLESQGFTVRAEVRQCDIVAVREEVVIAIELKPAFGLPVLYQALERLSSVDLVWVAVAVPEGKRARENWDAQAMGAIRLCAMLGVGLITVQNEHVDVLNEPHAYQPRKSARKRVRLLAEFNGRTGDFNVGGTTKRPRVTAYREDALKIALRLGEVEFNTAALIGKQTGIKRSYTILNRNVYGWFNRVGKGKFSLAQAGEEALLEYADVIRAQNSHGQKELLKS